MKEELRATAIYWQPFMVMLWTLSELKLMVCVEAQFSLHDLSGLCSSIHSGRCKNREKEVLEHKKILAKTPVPWPMKQTQIQAISLTGTAANWIFCQKCPGVLRVLTAPGVRWKSWFIFQPDQTYSLLQFSPVPRCLQESLGQEEMLSHWQDRKFLPLHLREQRN